jgi:hypothetical protein
VEFTNSTHAVLRFKTPLHAAVLRQALGRLVARHTVLSAHVADTDGGPRFVLNPSRVIDVTALDLSSVPAESRVRDAAYLAGKLVWMPFGVDEHWMRVFSIRLSATDFVLGFVIHHFIADGLSVDIAARELLLTYASIVTKRTVQLCELPIQYFDYVAGLNAWLASGAAERHMKHWQTKLRNAPSSLIRPDREIDPDVPGQVLTEAFEIEGRTIDRLRSYAVQHNWFLHSVILAVVAAALASFNGASEVVVVTRTSGRLYPPVQCLIGAFFDAIAIRIDVRGSDTFHELAAQTNATYLESIAHQQIPYQLVKDLLPSIGASAVAPFVNFKDAESRTERGPMAVEKFEIPPRPVEMHNARRYSSFNMPIVIHDDGLRGSVDYLSLSYRPETVPRFVRHFCTIVHEVAADPLRSLSALASTVEHALG